MENCLFCNINDLTQKAIILENYNYKIILDPYPVSFGHLLIVPNRHVNELEQLKDKEFYQINDLIQEGKSIDISLIEETYRNIIELSPPEKSLKLVKNALEQKNSPDGFNIGINEGKAAGQTIDHLHIHVIPRYEGDVENPEGGVRNVIPDKADYT